MTSPFRLEPAMPAAAYKTYGIRSPQRPATCEEVSCQAYLHGWKTVVPGDSPQAAYIRSRQCGRSYTETAGLGGLAEFTFGPGQVCFAAADHRLPQEGRERFFVRGGDFRGNPRQERRIFTRPDDFVEDFALHQEKLKTTLERG